MKRSTPGPEDPEPKRSLPVRTNGKSIVRSEGRKTRGGKLKMRPGNLASPPQKNSQQRKGKREKRVI